MNITIQTLLDRKGKTVHTAGPDMSVAEAVHRMNRHHIGALPVSDGQRLLGIFTERDVMLRVIEAGLDCRSTRVGDAMTTELRTVTPQTTVQEAMRLVTEFKCRHLPVLANGELAGLVSIGDLLHLVLYQQEHQIDDLMHYITDTTLPAATRTGTG